MYSYSGFERSTMKHPPSRHTSPARAHSAILSFALAVALLAPTACSQASTASSIVAADGGLDSSGAAVAAPRPIAPASASILTGRRPTFRWVLGTGSDGAKVDVCGDRACSRILTTFASRGSTATPSEDLPTGIVFWRLHGTSGTTAGENTSATWEMSVPALPRQVTTTWGALIDGNGDGLGDVVVGDSDTYAPTQHVYAFASGDGGIANAAPAVLSATKPSSYYASSIAGAGDVNGDGFPELLVGSPYESKVYVYAGGPSGYAEPPVIVLSGPAMSKFGTAVSSAGDVNGDGYGDVVIGGPTLTSEDASPGPGGAFVYLGSAAGLTAAGAIQLPNISGTQSIGQFVAAAGDLNGDGLGDVAVYGGVGAADPQYLELYMGSLTSFGQKPPVTLEYEGASGTWLGIANLLIGAGDVNGDGYADLAMASTSPPNSYYQIDHVTLFYGGPSGPSRIPSARIDSAIGTTDHFGTSLAAADFYGDGTTDLGVAIVSNVARPPVAQVFQGQSPLPSLSMTLTTTDPTVVFLREVGATDFDGDGIWDLVVGFPGRQTSIDGGTLNGAVQIYRGGPQGIGETPSATLLPPDTTAQSFGASLVRP